MMGTSPGCLVADVGPGRAFPASHQNETKGGKSSQQSSEVLQEILKELDEATLGGLIPLNQNMWEAEVVSVCMDKL